MRKIEQQFFAWNAYYQKQLYVILKYVNTNFFSFYKTTIHTNLKHKVSPISMHNHSDWEISCQAFKKVQTQQQI